jgi:hypothetical protein
MNLDEKYQLFREQYFETTGEFVKKYFQKAPEVAKMMMSPAAPMTKQEWLQKELKEAIEIENYEYCTQLKKELDGLQKDVRTDGESGT